jgi:hypothetical protein
MLASSSSWPRLITDLPKVQVLLGQVDSRRWGRILLLNKEILQTSGYRGCLVDVT